MWTAEDRERYEGGGRRHPSDLTDAEWEPARSLPGTGRTLTGDVRALVDGCPRLGTEGRRWRSLPEDFGPRRTVRGHRDRFRRDGTRAGVAAVPAPAARARRGGAPAPSAGIVGSRSVAPGPREGGRGGDGDEEVGGVERHLLTRASGSVPAVPASAANPRGTHGLGPLPERAAEAGRDLRRAEVDAVRAGPAARAAAERHDVDVRASIRDPAAPGSTPPPVRWRIEAAFGTPTDRHRRLTGNLEPSGEAAGNVTETANLRRVPGVLSRSDQNLAQ
jgi:putative transposase